MKIKILMAMLAVVTLTGCSSMNSGFSCNKTATDQCLSIEDVDRMTGFADDDYRMERFPRHEMKAERRSRSDYAEEDNSKELLWTAPWKDNRGLVHKEETQTKERVFA